MYYHLWPRMQNWSNQEVNKINFKIIPQFARWWTPDFKFVVFSYWIAMLWKTIKIFSSNKGRLCVSKLSWQKTEPLNHQGNVTSPMQCSCVSYSHSSCYSAGVNISLWLSLPFPDSDRKNSRQPFQFYGYEGKIANGLQPHQWHFNR